MIACYFFGDTCNKKFNETEKSQKTPSFSTLTFLQRNMIMKVKKSPQQTVTLLDLSYSHLCYCIIYVVFTICLIDSGWHRIHVDAYIDRATNRTNSVQQYRPQYRVHAMNVSDQNEWPLRTRDSRFLFDAFFGIDTPPIGADEFEEDDDDEEDAPKPCKCNQGKVVMHPIRFIYQTKLTDGVIRNTKFDNDEHTS